MNKIIKEKIRALLFLFAMLLTSTNANAISLWVGESYTWDFSGSILGSTYNMNVSTSGGYLSVTGSGFYRKITPTQYFSGTATVTAEWDYTLYYGDTKHHQRVSVSITCRENKVSIYPTSISLVSGETYQLSYSHQYDNQYVGAANVYFSGGNSSFSVTSGGLVTAKSPGSGYVNVYSKLSSAASAPYCIVTVKDVEVTGASISNYNVLADQTIDLNVNVSPSNATVKSKQWYVKSGSDVVSISGSRLTGLKPGSAVVYCMINGSVRSNDATVTVTEPKLTKTEVFPAEGASGISVFVVPCITYSHAISTGEGWSGVSLSDASGKVDGMAEINGIKVRFFPSKPLKPLAKYTFSVPRNAVKNKWGSGAQGDMTLSFTTADYEKASLVLSPESGSYLTSGDKITMKPTPSDAKVYYTLDGTEPTTKSSLYTAPLQISEDVTVKAFAMCDGYKNSDVMTCEYYRSQSEILDYYPNDNSPLFNYGPVCPSLTFGGKMEKSNNFRRISLKTSSGESVSGEALLTLDMVVFVPDEPLKNSTTYTLDIPRDAIKTENGEVFKGFNWSFTTPTMTVQVGMQGDESVYVLAEDGQLRMRGMDYQSFNSNNGSYTFKDYQTLADRLTNVEDISCGYTHRLIKTKSGTAGYGLAYCGETGTSSSISSIGQIKSIKAGFQTSAIIGEDNSLWMCGRNDFYQLGDSTGTTSKTFIKVADNVIDVAPGNGYTLYVDTDNILWAVGRNHKGQLGDGTTQNKKKPVKIMEGVAKVYVSKSGFFSACITTNNQLLTWGDNSYGQLGYKAEKYSPVPTTVMSDVTSAAMGEGHVLATNDKYKLYAWGTNNYGQIGDETGNITSPILMAEQVMAVSAGPYSSLVLFNNGKVTGWGRTSHGNFGTSEVNAQDYTVCEGYEYKPLQGAIIVPLKIEASPDSRFALKATPTPINADFESVEWMSANPEIARVEGNGIIQTGETGETTVTVRYTDRFGAFKETISKIVCTENPVNNGINDVVGNGTSWTAYAKDNAIVIENVSIGEVYRVYNLQGATVGQCKAENENLKFYVNQSGVYLVQSGNKVVKIVCR